MDNEKNGMRMGRMYGNEHNKGNVKRKARGMTMINDEGREKEHIMRRITMMTQGMRRRARKTKIMRRG